MPWWPVFVFFFSYLKVKIALDHFFKIWKSNSFCNFQNLLHCKLFRNLKLFTPSTDQPGSRGWGAGAGVGTNCSKNVTTFVRKAAMAENSASCDESIYTHHTHTPHSLSLAKAKTSLRSSSSGQLQSFLRWQETIWPTSSPLRTLRSQEAQRPILIESRPDWARQVDTGCVNFCPAPLPPVWMPARPKLRENHLFHKLHKLGSEPPWLKALLWPLSHGMV